MKIMDCTLRDGANVVGNGFDAELTEMVIRGLIANNICIIEIGNAKGLGGADDGCVAPLSDEEYLMLAKPYLQQAEIGMFLNVKRYKPENIELAAGYGLTFLRCGADAGNGVSTYEVIRNIKNHGMKARYSLMKAYLLTPEELGEEASGLEKQGLDEITIMDSAGTMMPEEAGRYVKALKEKLTIPVSYHCHNNLGLSAANVVAAYENGADVLDCGLLGMARSAGNMPTELAVALMQRYGCCQEVNLYGLLHFLDDELIPAMEKRGYRPAIKPLDLVLGLSGCHSAFVKTFKKVSAEYKVDLYEVISRVSKINRKNPSVQLIQEVSSAIGANKH